MDHGTFEGESEELNPKTPKDNETFFVPYGGESRTEVKDRTVKTCTEITEKENHNIVHAGACYNFLNAWQNPDEELSKGFTNCCIFKYEYEDKKFKLIEVIRHKF